jgi:hypothetical protein
VAGREAQEGEMKQGVMDGMPPAQKVVVAILAIAAVALAVARLFASSQEIVAYLVVS